MSGDANPVPRFAVVGHPNKGKSSIVATLAEDDQVEISPLPGTTRSANRYPLRVDDAVLYELFDTPGFQRPRQTLAWLQAQQPAADQRPATVAAFVAAHRGDPQFHDECALLEPLLDGAGVLYVVDGSRPYGAEYEAEMEILRWTGRPGMALINLIGSGDHLLAWRQALTQYFSIVRVFDARQADFAARLSLLRGFAELDERWRPALERAVTLLQADRDQRHQQAAAVIARLLGDVLSLQLRQRLAAEAPEAPAKDRLLDRLLSRIRQEERQARRQVEGIYRHTRLQREEAEATLLDLELFSGESWQMFGLSRRQLITTGATSGALAGGGVDLMLGGASLLLGSGIGALIGGAGAAFGGRRLAERLAKTRVLGLPLGGRELVLGPIQDANFPWVMLGRALVHQRLVAERNHAHREALVLSAEQGRSLMDGLDHQTRRAFIGVFDRIRRAQAFDSSDIERLTALVFACLQQPGLQMSTSTQAE